MSTAKVEDTCCLHESNTYKIENFQFECGETLSGIDIAYETWGQLNEAQDNAVIVCHALTGDAHAGNSKDGESGWWAKLIQPGGLLDTNRFFVVCINVIGGCSGSSGPSSQCEDGSCYGLRFPQVTIRDMVKSQIELTKILGIRRIRFVIGGSLGGMQAWEWACIAGDMVDDAIIIAADATFSPLGIGYNSTMRQALTSDPNWQSGSYYKTGKVPAVGLGVARAIGMLTYRTGELFQERFARDVVDSPGGALICHDLFTKPVYQIESYLYHAGDKLNSRFDANSYLYLTRAMDSHDIGRNRGGIATALQCIKTCLTIVGITGDYLYTPRELERTVTLASSIGINACYVQMESIYGHDAFLADQSQLQVVLSSIID